MREIEVTFRINMGTRGNIIIDMMVPLNLIPTLWVNT